MDRAHFIFGIYILFFAVFFALIFATPLVAFARDASGLYQFFSATCHQKISRSLCIFEDGRVGDCTAQSGQFVDNENDRAQTSAVVDGKLGYKMPVCARDVTIFGFVNVGLVAALLIAPSESLSIGILNRNLWEFLSFSKYLFCLFQNLRNSSKIYL